MNGVVWLSHLDPRTRRLLIVGAAAYLGRLGGALAVLIYAGMAQQALGPERFGVWMWLSALLGFAAFADLGVGYALLNRVTKVQAGAEGQTGSELAHEILAACACTLFLGILLLAGWWLWLALAVEPTSVVGAVTAQHKQEVLSALNTFMCLFAVNLTAGLAQRVQLGALDGHWVGVAQFVASAITLVALPLVLSMGGGLSALVWSTLGVQCLVNMASAGWWMVYRGLESWLRHAALRRDRVMVLLRQGAWFFGLQLAAALAFQSDAIVITQLLGVTAYGEFSVVQRLFLLISAAVGAGISGLWPAFGDAIARSDLDWVRRTLRAGLLLTALVTGSLCVGLLLVMDTVSVRWLSIAAPPALALTLALAFWTVVEALGQVAAACMNGANLLRQQLFFALTMATLALATKWWAVQLWGSPGVVWATLLAYLAVSVPGQIYIFRRMFSTPKGQT